jgi:hypothetical protein
MVNEALNSATVSLSGTKLKCFSLLLFCRATTASKNSVGHWRPLGLSGKLTFQWLPLEIRIQII